MIAPVFKSLFRKDPVRSQAETLHDALARQARAPEFFLAGGAPDTAEGRFEVLAAHMFLALRRLRREAPATDRLMRLVQEVFFERLDSALREMGVGDLVVGRKIRALAEAFYGRNAAYERALADGGENLAGAIARNILNDNDATRGEAIAKYVAAAAAHLDKAPVEDLARAISELEPMSRAIGKENIHDK
mgnify:CR=1 FL=1